MFFSVDHIIQVGGTLLVASIIFAECGLLVGFFLPGDTLLIAAGILASQHKYVNIYFLLPAVLLAAIIGYQVGYQIGARGGPRVFRRKDGILFRKDYIPRTERFVTHHGGKTMILARFIAVVRTLVPLVAGIGKMNKHKFLFYNVLGAAVWTGSITLGSYWIGSRISNVDKLIIPIVMVGVVLTAGAEFWFVLRNQSSRRQLVAGLREEYNYFFKKKV